MGGGPDGAEPPTAPLPALGQRSASRRESGESRSPYPSTTARTQAAASSSTWAYWRRDQPIALRTKKSGCPRLGSMTDRKSTRLNSSHVKISYAVFCLKKKRPTHFPLTPDRDLHHVL